MLCLGFVVCPLKMQLFGCFLVASEDAEYKIGYSKKWKTKLRHLFQLDALIFTIYFLKNNQPAPSEAVEAKMTLLRSLRPNFVFHPIFTDFHLEIRISVLFGFGVI